MTRKNLFMAVVFVLSMNAVVAQKKGGDYNYSTAVGIKFYPTGISFKQFLKDDKAVEAIGYFWRGARITGLYEVYKDLNLTDGLRWYFGGGAHVAFYNTNYYGGSTLLGIDGVLGLDYKFKNTPLNISLDWQPSFDFGDGAGFGASWGGIGVRYVLK